MLSHLAYNQTFLSNSVVAMKGHINVPDVGHIKYSSTADSFCVRVAQPQQCQLSRHLFNQAHQLQAESMKICSAAHEHLMVSDCPTST